VVQTGEAAEENERLMRAFETLSDRDERTHVHMLAKGDVPNFFSHAA
jgi:hypothetical protein